MTGSRPSSKAWSSVSGPVLHAPPPLATPPVTVTHTTVPTEPSLLHSNSPYRSARINNTAALRFSGFDAGPRIRPPIAFEEDSRNGTGGAANARGIGIVKPPGLRAHLRASTVHARTRLYLVVERAALHGRIHANTGIGMHDRGGGEVSLRPAYVTSYLRSISNAPFHPCSVYTATSSTFPLPYLCSGGSPLSSPFFPRTTTLNLSTPRQRTRYATAGGPPLLKTVSFLSA